ncbi:MAG: DUF4328 domain-containing protein [Blastocatellia bacterium]
MENTGKFEIKKWKTVTAAVMLIVALISSIGSSIIEINYFILIKGLEKGKSFSDSEILFTEKLVNFAGIGQLAITIVCAIPFCLWFYQAYNNLLVLGVKGLKYSPAWAVGSFFVPILNLSRPQYIAKEIWNASEPNSVSSESNNWAEVSEPTIISCWWISFLLPTALKAINSLFFTDLFDKGKTFSELQYSSIFFILSNLSWAVSAVFAILLIFEINKKQQQKYSIISSTK